METPPIATVEMRQWSGKPDEYLIIVKAAKTLYFKTVVQDLNDTPDHAIHVPKPTRLLHPKDTLNLEGNVKNTLDKVDKRLLIRYMRGDL